MKKRKSKTGDDRRPWEDLPIELLDIVSSHMTIPDYLSFGRACHSWRSYFLDSNKRFTASRPPLVCYISAWDVNSCFFHDITDGNSYEATLPDFTCKFCIGVSCGYIIMGEFFSDLWFTNPVTGYQHLFSSMPQSDYCMYRSDRFILASTGPNQDILIVLLCRKHYSVWYRRSTDMQWSSYSFVDKPWVVDMVVFNSRVVVITNMYQIGILSLRSSDVRFLEFRGTPRGCFNPRFVTSNEQLYVVDFLPSVWLEVYKVDFSIMEWVKVDNIGDQALFLGDMMGTGMSSTTRWGGRSNCVYYLSLATDQCYVYSWTGAYVDSIQITGEDRVATARLKCWYFIDQAHNMYYVSDE
ncbi:hypothetical protein JRO89_XS01G0225000 [Xanthoceras sorbifolium]|uniref:F-box domain-containing protein n=1 Tax=Xanthoceras sorbifolium TaxID=99658 RepID=A0ABQ8ILB4_9ROSI|nr:hypothetical protein JRO89_XS01G0225000 [Xanthoceras sorbifolium]